MFWIKLGILLTGFLYAGLLPYTTKKALQHINFDPKLETLSFLSNKWLYGKDCQKGYQQLLFASAVLTYIFFWLLSKFYDLGEREQFMRQIDYTVAVLTILAFSPHNILPYSFFKRPGTTLQRLLHNIFGGIVFLALPLLIILFQVSVLSDYKFMGITGLVMISILVILVGFSFLKNGLTGTSEILFINGISIWTIFVTIMTIML
ncbi:MAG: hypothetical protein JW798_09520 [Prolixibacteraceae bacterium]|nr:hypothetical protein [Prolixibacteraceae bacterium]